MSMTVVVTRDVEDRYRGFLLSCMLEISPGTYLGPKLNAGIRDRLWEVMELWHGHLRRGSITMVCLDQEQPSGMAIRCLGSPPKDLVDLDGFLAVRTHLD